jgi:hypothetical protein
VIARNLYLYTFTDSISLTRRAAGLPQAIVALMIAYDCAYQLKRKKKAQLAFVHPSMLVFDTVQRLCELMLSINSPAANRYGWIIELDFGHFKFVAHLAPVQYLHFECACVNTTYKHICRSTWFQF